MPVSLTMISAQLTLFVPTSQPDDDVYTDSYCSGQPVTLTMISTQLILFMPTSHPNSGEYTD